MNGASIVRWSWCRICSLLPVSPWQSQEEKQFFLIKSHNLLNCFVKSPPVWNALQGLAALSFSSSYWFGSTSGGKKICIRAEYRWPESPTTTFCSAYGAFPTIKEFPVRAEFIYLPGIGRQRKEQKKLISKNSFCQAPVTAGGGIHATQWCYELVLH